MGTGSESNYVLYNIQWLLSFTEITFVFATMWQHKWSLCVHKYSQMIQYVKIFRGNIHWECSFAYVAHSLGIAKQKRWKLQFIIFPQSSASASHCLRLVRSSVFSPASAISSFLSFFLCSATQIDSAFLISQHNPINFIVIAAINI